MNNKKIIFIIISVLLIIGSSLFLFKNNYKKVNLGNNITKSQEKLEEYILNINSYEAEVEVTINSNKNTNKYLIKQKFCSPNTFSQEVIQPENIAGLKTILDGEKLTIENSKINLTQIYENYEYLNENSLSLYDFIQDYMQDTNSKYIKNEDNIILETKPKQENPYLKNKKLYLDGKTGMPIKMEVQDNNQNTLVYILYKEVKINSTNRESIIAFKLLDHKTNI